VAPEPNPEKLERLVRDLVRDLPLRQAPTSLAPRVLERVAAADQRATSVWWRRSFVHWPVGARIAFLVASLGFIRVVLLGAVSAAAYMRLESFTAASHPALTWLRAAASLGFTALDTIESLARAIPTFWLYGAIIAAAALYAAMFGLGTVAYRTLYVEE